MADQNRTWQQTQDEMFNASSEQWKNRQPNAFGQEGQGRYQANDQFPQKTGSVSWQSGQQEQHGQQSQGGQQGHQGQHRGKGPKGYTRSDDRIREDVYHSLTEAHDVDATDIEVDVRNGEVTLMGSVLERDQRRKAEDLIEKVSGVNHVQNNLRVGQQGSPSPSSSFNRQDSERNSGSTTGTQNSEVI